MMGRIYVTEAVFLPGQKREIVMDNESADNEDGEVAYVHVSGTKTKLGNIPASRVTIRPGLPGHVLFLSLGPGGFSKIGVLSGFLPHP